jgi:hypothetical protein
MQKKYIVRHTDEERVELQVVVKKLKGSSQKVRRVQVLLKADVNGPNWTDTSGLPKPSRVACKPSSRSANVWSNDASEKRLTAQNAKTHRPQNCSLENRKPRLLRCD